MTTDWSKFSPIDGDAATVDWSGFNPIDESTTPAPAPSAPAQRRGGTRSEARPYVAAGTGSGAGSAEFAAVDPRRTDRTPDLRPFTAGQVADDLKGGVEQLKALGTGAGAFAGAVDWRATTETLADLDALDAGQPATRTSSLQPAPGGGAPRRGEPNPIVRAYQAATPEQRQTIRQSLTTSLQRDQQFIAQAVEAIKGFNAEQQRLSGKMPDFTDIRTAGQFTEWAVRNGAATAPSMAASMLGALAGPLGLAATGGAMAVGDLTAARAEHASGALDPSRFKNPDRAQAAAARKDADIAGHLAENVGPTAALAVPYAALDFLGPAGTLATGGAKGLAKQGARAIVAKGAREAAEEAIGEGGQEVVNVAGEATAGERPTEWTGADTKRVVNAAAVGGLMGAGGHAVNTAADSVRGASDRRAREKAAEDGDVEQALMLAIEASPYGKASAKGFHVQPPLATDPPRKQRAAMEDVFENAASAYGAPKAAVQAALQAAERLPLAELGGFFSRVTQQLQQRGLMSEVDPDVIEAIGAGPVDPRASRTADDDPNATAVETIPDIPGPPAVPDVQAGSPDGAPVLETSTPLDQAAHAAATSPSNDLPEPSDAQKKAGNYKVGRLRIAGMDISVENPQGSTRSGTDLDGKAWQTTMTSHYGYFRRTEGADGDQLDVFVKPATAEDFAGPVFVVDQVDPATGKFDESKVMLGFDSKEEAEAAYLSNYAADWKGMAGITELPMPEFTAWAKSAAARKPLTDLGLAGTEPVPEGAPSAQAEAKRARRKADDERVGDVAGAAGGAAAAGDDRGREPGGSVGGVRPDAADAGGRGAGAAAAPAAGAGQAVVPRGAGAERDAALGHARDAWESETAKGLGLQLGGAGWHLPVGGLGEVVVNITSNPGDPLRAEVSAEYMGKSHDRRTAEGEPAIREAMERARAGIQEGRERMAREVAAKESGLPAEKPRALPAEKVGADQQEASEPAAPKPAELPVYRDLTDAEAFTEDFSRFEGKPLRETFTVASTGQMATLKRNAARALRDLHAKRQTLQELEACVRKQG